jgi:hypothetical protein
LELDGSVSNGQSKSSYIIRGPLSGVGGEGGFHLFNGSDGDNQIQLDNEQLNAMDPRCPNTINVVILHFFCRLVPIDENYPGAGVQVGPFTVHIHRDQEIYEISHPIKIKIKTHHPSKFQTID